MTKKLLTGLAAALFLAVGSAAYANVMLPQADSPNYEPGIDGSVWGQQAPIGWNSGGDAAELPAVGGNTIESVKFEDQPTYNGGFLFIPPDPHCAVGPNHIITVVNCTIQWYAKTGGAAQNIQPLGKQAATVTNSFFDSLTPINALFDPKVIYDQYSNRFIVVALEQAASPATSRVLFAMSNNSDPNGGWTFTSLNTALVLTGGNSWLDYPGLACDQNVIYLTGNYFTFAAGSSQGSRLWIMNKTAGAPTLLAGSPFNAAALATPISPNTGTAFNSTMMPAQMFGTPPAGVGTYLVMYSGLSDGVDEYLQTIRVDNPTGAISFAFDIPSLGNIDNTATTTLTRGIQPTSTTAAATRLDTGDRRVLQALWRNGNLYTVFHVIPNAGNPNATQCTAYWLRESITTGVGTIADGGYVGGEDVAVAATTLYPSIAVDKLGNIAIGLGVCSPTTFASEAYTTHSATDPVGFTNPLTVFASGLAYYRRTFSSSTGARNRWGDYTGTVVDPDGCVFWSYNEYAGTQGTATTVGTVTENGRWWTRAASYYVDDNRNGNPDGCEPVAVVLSKFEAVRDGAVGVIRWSVAEEHDHLGFNVFRETEGGARVIIHVGLLTGTTDYEIRDEDAPAGGAKYWLQEVDRSGKSHWIGSIDLAPSATSPALVTLEGARPNPFNQSTSVQFSLGSARQVNVSVYDIQGRKVSTLVDGIVDAGAHSATWNGRTDDGGSATSGFYFVKLQTAGQVKVVKVVLARGTASN